MDVGNKVEDRKAMAAQEVPFFPCLKPFYKQNACRSSITVAHVESFKCFDKSFQRFKILYLISFIAFEKLGCILKVYIEDYLSKFPKLNYLVQVLV